MGRAAAPEWRSIPFVRSFAGADDADRIQNLLEFQRDILLRYDRWESTLGRARPGGGTRSPITLILRPGGLSLQALRAVDGLVAFEGFPLASRPRTTAPLLFDPAEAPPTDSPVILEGVSWVPIAIQRRPGTDIEWALKVTSWSRGAARDYLPDPPSSKEISDIVPAVLDEFRRDARPTVEGALLGLAGAPRQVDGGAGMDLALGAPGLDSPTSIEAAARMAILLPPWETTTLFPKRPRYWGKLDRRLAEYAPYGVRLDRFSSSVGFRGHPLGGDESSILVGSGDGGTLLGMLFDGDHPVLRSADSITDLAMSNPTPEGLAPGASLLVYAHAVDVSMPSTPDLMRAEQRASDQVRDSLREFFERIDQPAKLIANLVRLSPGLRIGIRRAASAKARLSLRREVDQKDFKAVGDSFALSASEVSKHGDRRELAQFANAASAELSILDRKRFSVLEASLRGSPDSTPEEIWDSINQLELWDSLADMEEYIGVLVHRGAILRPYGDRRLRWGF